MDNQTIRNTFRELRKDQKLVLTCSEHMYVINHKDRICLCSGNDLQIIKEQSTIYIDCTYVQCMNIKPAGDGL